MSAINNLKSKKILTALLVVVVVVGIVVVARRPSKVSPPAASVPTSASVMINEDGFVPATLKIKKGTIVIWKNDDGDVHRVAANPLSSHTELPSLDSKTNIATNGTYRFVFTTTGTFHYHDEVNPSKYNGTITVE